MRLLPPRVVILILGCLASGTTQARADFTVAPNAYATQAGDGGLSTLLSASARTFQEYFFAPQLSSIAVGSTITQVAFRLESNVATVTRELDFASYNVQLGTIPLTASDSFASNMGPDTITVRTGPLVVAANTLQGGNALNAFNFVIAFTTPYVYMGGNLALTIRHTGNGVASPFLDMTTDISSGTSTRYASGSAATAPTSASGALIAQFQYSTVPEPASWLLCVAAGLTGLVVTRACRTATAA